MTERTFTAADYLKRARQLDHAAAISIGVKAECLRNDAAAFRQAADADSRWAELKAWLDNCDFRRSAATWAIDQVKAEMARIEGARA